MKISKTSDYSQFVFSDENRPLDTDHPKFRKLTESMKKHGWLWSFPMTVVRDGDKKVIVDGQNRFTAAKHLKIPVLFVVYDGQKELVISEINDTQRGWSIADHVGSRAAQGNSHYVYLKDFANRTGMPMLRAASLLWGEAADSGNVQLAVKAGRFEVRDVEYAERVASIAIAVKAHRTWALGTSFLGALSRVVRVKEFDDAHFIKKANTWVSLLNHEPLAVQDFIEMIEKIYNRSVRSPIPIKFLAGQSSRARCAVPGAKRSKAA